MGRIFFRTKTGCFSRLLFRVMLVLSITIIIACSAGSTEDGVRMLNASGNWNRAASVDPIGRSEGFSAVLYNNRNGLPTSEANAIAQTSDGFIWIGSYAGLIRYDGNTFERVNSTTGIANVRCLYKDSQDRLWIGTNDNGIFLMQRGKLRNWSKEEGLKFSSVRAIAEDGNNLIYFAGAPGMAVIDSNLNLTVLKDERISEQMIQDLRLGNDGLIYGLTQNGDLFTMKNGEILFFLSSEECRVKRVLSILPDPEKPGDVYLGTESSQIYYGNLERNFATLGIKGIGELNYVDGLEYVCGQIWICAGNGIGRIDDDGFHTLRNIPMDNSIGSMITDYEGNLWFTSTSQGIMKIVPNRFTDLFGQYDLPATVVNTTCMLGRRLFIGTNSGMIVLENGKRVDELPLTKAETASGTDLGKIDLLKFLDGTRIRSIFRDSKERLWISTWRKTGLICYDHGEMTVYTQDDGLLSDRVRTSIELEDGSILVANHGGVSVIRDGRVTAEYSEKDGIAVAEILTMAEGDNHELLLGSDGGGIYVIGPDGTGHIGTEEGLSSDVVMRIRRSTTQDVYWLITSNSFAFMTPDHQVTTVRKFPYPNNYDVYENSQGDVWILSSAGIYVVPAEELLANEEIEPVFFGIYSGLPYVATANAFSEQAADGNLYIASTAGVARINIENSFANTGELKFSVPYLEADEKRFYPDDEGNFTLPGTIRKLTIFPHVFNYAMVDPTVFYRLDGFDNTEITENSKDLGPVNYTNLPNATYQFMMRVKDPVSHTEKSMSFRIVKGGEASIRADGTIIMDIAALFFLGGILIYSSLYRQRGRLDDKLFFAMILVNMILAASEIISYLLEFTPVPLSREMMYLMNTIFYLSLETFPYLFLLFLEFRVYRNTDRIRKVKLLYGIPLVFVFILLLVNLQTGWIFSIKADNTYVSGPADQFVFIPILLYFLVSLSRAHKVSPRLVFLGILLIFSRIVWDIWYIGISSSAFLYVLFLVCTFIHVTDQPVKNEEAP